MALSRPHAPRRPPRLPAASVPRGLGSVPLRAPLRVGAGRVCGRPAAEGDCPSLQQAVSGGAAPGRFLRRPRPGAFGPFSCDAPASPGPLDAAAPEPGLPGGAAVHGPALRLVLPGPGGLRVSTGRGEPRAPRLPPARGPWCIALGSRRLPAARSSLAWPPQAGFRGSVKFGGSLAGPPGLQREAGRRSPGAHALPSQRGRTRAAGHRLRAGLAINQSRQLLLSCVL